MRKGGRERGRRGDRERGGEREREERERMHNESIINKFSNLYTSSTATKIPRENSTKDQTTGKTCYQLFM